jgi:hypothetical protein
MNITRWMGAAATFLFGAALWTGTAQAQVTQAELARIIAEGGSYDRFAAVQKVLEMGPRTAGPGLRDALVRAFTDEAEAFRAYRRGEAPPPDLDAIGAMAMVVSEFRDPRAFEPMIATLAVAMGSVRGLAAIGDPAVGPLVDIARAGGPEEMMRAFLTLRLLAEGVGRIPLSSSSREELIAVASERLAPGPSYGAVLEWAIDLAAVLDDPGLRETLETMAADPTAVEARLVNPEAERVSRIQHRASERLRGVPPRPTWIALSSRFR